MPSMSSSGKESPQSTTTILSSNSKAVMFIPICSSPPRGMIRNFELLIFLKFFPPDSLFFLFPNNPCSIRRVSPHDQLPGNQALPSPPSQALPAYPPETRIPCRISDRSDDDACGDAAFSP